MLLFSDGRRSLHRRVATLTILLAAAWLRSLSFVIQLQNEFISTDSLISKIAEKPKSINRGGDSTNTSKNVHVVFSTDCSGYQHWQSIAAYYSIKRAGHLGRVTRIASGCKPAEQEKIRDEINKMDPSRFMVHFTPSFAINGGYKYSNKPGGLNHWIMNTDMNIDEEVIALVDPDMMLMRPITPELGAGLTAVPVSKDRTSADMIEYRDEQGTVQILRKSTLPDLPLRVEKGTAAGQHFGIGVLWVPSGTNDARKDFKNFNLTAVCGIDSPCLNKPRDGPYTTREYAESYYSVGPLYICSTSDWKALLPRWHQFTPLVHEQYPKLLAEMYGFTMAAADRQLKFALSSSYMVSDANTMSPTESWLWIDEYGSQSTGNSARSVCEGAKFNSLPTETLRRLYSYGYGHYAENDVAAFNWPLPVTLHYCQRYLFANHTFAKRKMNQDFFRCDGSPLEFDIEKILKALDTSVGKVQKRTAFMICHLIPLINMALEDYKRDVCT
ncbi:hypothetical protein ACHAXN_008975 [Cyclotella atomus]